MSRITLIVVLGLMLAACGGGSSGGGVTTGTGGTGGPPPTYFVSGSVTGLNGNVVLQNNGGDTLTVGANGTFIFSTQLASGAAYAVSVQSAPSSQRCLVSSGSGAVTANVTNVRVECASIMSIIDSTPVSGSKGVVRSQRLELIFSVNIDSATVNSGAIQLKEGDAVVAATYATTDDIVTVQSASPLKAFTQYTLNVQDGIRGTGGEVLNAPSTISFTTNDIAWSTPARIPQAGSVQDMAMDANGNAFIVWSQSNSVYASRQPAGGEWSTPVVISDGARPGIGLRIKASANGDALAIWGQTKSASTSDTSVWVNRYQAGTGWGAATLISSLALNAAGGQIAIDALGNAVAIWSQAVDSTNSKYNIFANFLSSTTGWGTAAPVQSDVSMDGRSPVVARTSNGEIVVAWRSHSIDLARVSRHVPGVGWASEVQLSPAGLTADRPDDIGVDGSGNAMVVSSASGYIRAYRYSSGGGWDAGTTISETGQPNSARIAVNASGDALAIWVNGGTWTNRFTIAGGWKSSERMNDDGLRSESPRIAIDSDGNGIAVWFDFPPAIMNIRGSPWYAWSNRYVAGAWGTNQLLLHESTMSDFPFVQIDGAGKALLGWSEWNGGFVYSRSL